MAYFDTINLFSGHSLIKSHLPNSIPVKAISDIQVPNRSEIEKYGLFDVATPNFVTYYPDVKPEDLNPTDAEFIMPIYRSLSKVVVHKNWNPVDFSMGKVLEDSMGLLVGQSVYPNHEAVVGNELGAVADVAWDNGYISNGVKVPAGINSRLKIDGKSNPKLARGILMDPPSVHSTSVTVSFFWEKSHGSLSEEDFFRKLGTYDADGELIRRIATKIKNYGEISFVSHGADPFAQKVGSDGKIVNPKYANTVYNSATSPEIKREHKFFSFDFKYDLIKNSTEEENTTPEISLDNKNNRSTMNRAFLLSLAAIMGLAADKVPTDDIELSSFITGKVAELKNASTNKTTSAEDAQKMQQLQAEVDRLKPMETELAELKKVDSTKLKEFQDTILGKLRTDVKAMYAKISDNKPVESISNMIETADYTALTALNEDYTAQLDSKYPAKCSKCGSTEVTRASAKKQTEENKGEFNLGNFAEKNKDAKSTIKMFDTEVEE